MEDGRTVHFSKLNFKKNFLRAHRAEAQNVHDVFRVSGGNGPGVLGDILGRHVARQDNGGARGSDADLLVWEEAVDLFRSRCNVDIHPQIETAGTLQFVPDQQRNFTGCEPIDQHLRGSDDERVGNAGIGHRNALQSLGGVNEKRLADHHPQWSSAWALLRGCSSGRNSRLRHGRVALRGSRSRRVLRTGVGTRGPSKDRSDAQEHGAYNQRMNFHEFEPLRRPQRWSLVRIRSRESFLHARLKTWFRPAYCHESFPPHRRRTGSP